MLVIKNIKNRTHEFYQASTEYKIPKIPSTHKLEN